MDAISGSASMQNNRSDLINRIEQRFERRTEFLESAGYADRAQKIAQRGEKIVEQLANQDTRGILDPLTNPRVTQAIGKALEFRSELASENGYTDLSALISLRADRLQTASGRAEQAVELLDVKAEHQEQITELRAAVNSYVETSRANG